MRGNGCESVNQVKDVQLIRDQQQLEDMKWALKRHCLERDYILFVLGCETRFRKFTISTQTENPANFYPKKEIRQGSAHKRKQFVR